MKNPIWSPRMQGWLRITKQTGSGHERHKIGEERMGNLPVVAMKKSWVLQSGDVKRIDFAFYILLGSEDLASDLDAR